MPIYEYACGNCGHSFDELQKISEAALVHCPSCNDPALRKVLSAPKFRLKGQGWYETDFKTGEKRNLHGESEPQPKDDKKSTDKSSTDKSSADKSSASKSSDSKASTA